MKNLLLAVYDKFNSGGDLELEGGDGLELEGGGVIDLEGSDIYAALGGRLYLSEAPQTAAMPYCVYDLISAEPEYHFGFRHETATIQFAIYTDDGSATNALTYGGYLKTLYDNCSLTITGYTHIDFNREQSDRLIRNSETMTWQWSCDYEVLMSV